MAKVLAPYSRPVERILHKRPVRRTVNAINTVLGLRNSGDAWITGIHQHATASEYLAVFGPEVFGKSYKFACVRNPCTLLLSEYLYIKRSRFHHMHKFANSVSFDDFISWKLNSDALRQVDFVTIDRKMVLDRVLRFENIAEDYSATLDRPGIPDTGLPVVNKTRNSEKTAYVSGIPQSTLDRIYEHFAMDFEAFGYERQRPESW